MRELSGRQKSETSGAVEGSNSGKSGEKKGRKHRAADIGRALRSVYDDTVREQIPDDFQDLLGRLR